jgi:hypothetical protein
MEASGQRHALAVLYPRYALDRRLGGPQNRSGQIKIYNYDKMQRHVQFSSVSSSILWLIVFLPQRASKD